MSTRITGIYPYKNKFKSIDIFGYSTNSLPEIEILGLGKRGRLLKEKFTYLTRLNEFEVPLKRFVLVVENCDGSFSKNTKKEDPEEWLELPLLILYWSLAGIVPISKLDDCFCAGKVSADGTIRNLSLTEEYLFEMSSLLSSECKTLKYISQDLPDSYESIESIPLDELLNSCYRSLN